MTTPVTDKTTMIGSLKSVLAPNQIITNAVELMTYEVDAARDRGAPDGVVIVHDTEQVVSVVQWAAENGVPLVARGAGTGLSGGAVPEQGGVVLEFSRMNRVLDFDVAGRTVVFQPGVVNQTLDELVKRDGLYFPPDPASGRTSTLGGNIAENAGGPHCFKYGVTTNYITGLEVVLADGRKLCLGGRVADCPEYDLVGLLTGNEGTLALITEATARLLRNVPAVKTMMAAFDSVEQAGAAVSAVIARGLVPATVEMMDRTCMRIIEDFTHAGLPAAAAAGLIIETDGYPESVSPQMDEIAAILRQYRAHDLRIARTAAEREHIWYGRKSTAGAFARVAPAWLNLDCTVPRSKLAQTLGAINRIGNELRLVIGYAFHAGDGNLHPNVFYDPTDEAQAHRAHQAAGRIMAMCVEARGSITGEHGVGIEKRDYMPLMFNADELRTFREIKQVFDPNNRLNPGKIFPKDEALYVPPARLAPVAATAFPPRATLPAELRPPAQEDPWAELTQNDLSLGYEQLLNPPRQDIGPLTPTGAEEAAEALRNWSAQEELRYVRIRGGGTKSGQLPSTDEIISTEAMRRIHDFALDDLYVTVGAGASLDALQQELRHSGVWVPLVSPWGHSTVGGIVAANYNAPLRMRYGALRDLVLAMTVALADGRVLRLGRPVVKNVAGYDLAKLFVGSHGSLGLICDVTLKMSPLPRARATLTARVDDLGRAMACGTKLLQVCMVASSLLLCRSGDVPADRLVSRSGEGGRYALVYTAEGVTEDVRAELNEARTVLESEGLHDITQVEELSGSDIWARWMHSGMAPDTVLRSGVAVKDMGGLMTKLVSVVGKAPLVADLANGLIYARSKDVAGVRRLTQAAGGYTVVLNSPEPKIERWGYAPQGLDLVKALKARWDPRGILNPDAFIL